MSGLVRICPVRTDPLGKMLINHVLLIETLTNLTQGYSSTLEITYSRITTCIVGYKSRSQKLDIET
jgi:predicted nucleic-acid-binding protein